MKHIEFMQKSGIDRTIFYIYAQGNSISAKNTEKVASGFDSFIDKLFEDVTPKMTFRFKHKQNQAEAVCNLYNSSQKRNHAP